MDNETQVVNVLESFLHDVMEGESDVSEITNMLGYNELKVLLKLAKKGLADPTPVPGSLHDVERVKNMYEFWRDFEGESMYSPETIASVILDVTKLLGVDLEVSHD